MWTVSRRIFDAKLESGKLFVLNISAYGKLAFAVLALVSFVV